MIGRSSVVVVWIVIVRIIAIRITGAATARINAINAILISCSLSTAVELEAFRMMMCGGASLADVLREEKAPCSR